MNLRSLQYFAVTAEEGHITRAAERLQMRQPPLSRQIKALERELGVQLFRRTTRGVVLTAAGGTLYDASRDILMRVQRAIEGTQQTAQGKQGFLRIGAAPTAPFNALVPRSVCAYREAFPGVALTLEETTSDELFKRLQNDEIDVAFYRSPPIDSAGLKLDTLLQEPMIMAMPKGMQSVRTGRRKSLPLSAFAEETFIVYGRRTGRGLYEATIAACHEAGFSPRLGQEAPRIVSTLNLVAAGLGVALVPACLQQMRVEGVRYCSLHGPVKPRALLAIATRRGETSATVRQFLKTVSRNVALSSVTGGARDPEP